MATTALRDFAFVPDVIEVLAPGAQSSLQELPGRLGLWHVGVPPSGPMDERSFRHANRLVGNADETAALELTVSGPTLRFHSAATDRARRRAHADDARRHAVAARHARSPSAPARCWRSAAIDGPGQRAYLAVAGGFAAPSCSARAPPSASASSAAMPPARCKAGDVLHLARARTAGLEAGQRARLRSPATGRSACSTARTARRISSSPTTSRRCSRPTYEVHFNSARTGVRLIGPAPKWARTDGGEAGLHPSNLHDNAYAIGAIDFTGDMPIILGPDGPSLGGFVCPAVIARDEQWKMGQFKPGDTHPLPCRSRAPTIRSPARRCIAPATRPVPPIVGRSDDGPVPVVYRRQGDDNLLVEYGPMTLDIALRLRVHLLMQAVSGREASRHHRPHARHPLAADPL